MRNKLKQIFKTINYVPFPECNIEANLATQFTDHALNQIADALIAKGVIVPPIRVGQTCYYIDRADIRRPIKEELCVEIQDGYNHSVIVLQDSVTKLRFAHTFGEVGRTIFLSKEEAEKKMKEFMYG